ncbi:MAG: rRNA adenine N-6-methyltransferase family protein [Natrialbaceae archaeon]|nr:rRNA adenine N-6-methyltransferase family protein [Natrialbaceae archaeon]
MRDPDRLRQRAGIRGDPNRDQHFLVDDRVLDRLPTYLTAIDADTTHLLEVGAGTGALTDRLLAIGETVTAIERDPVLASFLTEEFADAIAADRLDRSGGRSLTVELPPFAPSVSNLPYGVSSQIAFRLLPLQRPMVLTSSGSLPSEWSPSRAPVAYGRLSVSARHYASVEIVETIPPGVRSTARRRECSGSNRATSAELLSG